MDGASPPAETDLDLMYEGIPVSTLVVDSVVPIDLFTEIDGAGILYRAAGDTFTREQRRNLRETDLSQLLVRRADLDAYYGYIGGNLRTLLQGANGEPPHAADVHDVSVMAAGRAIEKPESKPVFELANQVIENAIGLTETPGAVLACIQARTPGLKHLRAHSMRVCFYGLQLARGIGISDPQELSDLGVGLMLHDLGKIEPGIGEITHDPQLSNHPLLGVGRLENVDHIGKVARDVIENHHERLDGNGRYHVPAEKISIYARIAAVANSFDRRTVDADGHTILNSFDALREMIAEDKGAYDPKLLAQFVRALSL